MDCMMEGSKLLRRFSCYFGPFQRPLSPSLWLGAGVFKVGVPKSSWEMNVWPQFRMLYGSGIYLFRWFMKLADSDLGRICTVTSAS